MKTFVLLTATLATSTVALAGCAAATPTGGAASAVYQAPNTENLNSLLLDLGGASNSKSVSGVGDKAYVSPVAIAAIK